MDTTLIRWNFPNWITVVLMVAVATTVIKFGGQLIMRGRNG